MLTGKKYGDTMCIFFAQTRSTGNTKHIQFFNAKTQESLFIYDLRDCTTCDNKDMCEKGV